MLNILEIFGVVMPLSSRNLTSKMLNKIIPASPSSVAAALELGAAFFQQHAGADGIHVSMAGHCHIDTAWLWPYAETVRKCARSWASTLRLLDQYPEMVFACSQVIFRI